MLPTRPRAHACMAWEEAQIYLFSYRVPLLKAKLMHPPVILDSSGTYEKSFMDCSICLYFYVSSRLVITFFIGCIRSIARRMR